MKKKILLFTGIFIVLIAVGALVVRSYLFATYDYEPVRVEIPAGATQNDVHSIITGALGDSFGTKVFNLWKLQKGTPARSHGSFKINTGDQALRVARKFAHGLQDPVKLTFNNIRKIGDFAHSVDLALEVDSMAIIATMEDVLPKEGFSKEEFTAAILPDTYEFYWTAHPERVIRKLLEYRNKFWSDERKKKAEALGLTPVQVHTLASIVEEETAKADERGKVARLYLNRLDKGMALQADPTVKFALGDFELQRIWGKHLDIDSPYNTYKHTGLPPGPIRVVEASTIDAVLNAPEHNYLYMCASDKFNGYHEFAVDYNRHRINAVKYHNALNKRGIK